MTISIDLIDCLVSGLKDVEDDDVIPNNGRCCCLLGEECSRRVSTREAFAINFKKVPITFGGDEGDAGLTPTNSKKIEEPRRL